MQTKFRTDFLGEDREKEKYRPMAFVFCSHVRDVQYVKPDKLFKWPHACAVKGKERTLHLNLENHTQHLTSIIPYTQIYFVT